MPACPLWATRDYQAERFGRSQSTIPKGDKYERSCCFFPARFDLDGQATGGVPVGTLRLGKAGRGSIQGGGSSIRPRALAYRKRLAGSPETGNGQADVHQMDGNQQVQ